MEVLFLNIAVLVVGTIGTLAAFGGETWIKGTAPLWKRVTRPRGWLALACLICACVLGIVEMVVSSNKARTAALEAKTAQDALTAQLADANRRLYEIRKNNNAIPREIDSAVFRTGSVTNGDLNGQEYKTSEVIKSSRTKKILTVMAGEVVRYSLSGDGEDYPHLVTLLYGDEEHTFLTPSGDIHLVGINRGFMTVQFRWPLNIQFGIRMSVISTSRSKP